MDIARRVYERFAGSMGLDLVRRVYLRYAFSRDPKIVQKEIEKLRGALKHLSTSKGDLTTGEDWHMYSQVIDSFRDIKFYCERAGIPVEKNTPALHVINHNPFNPAQALVDNESVFKEALGEVDALEADFAKAQQTLAGGHQHAHL